METDSAVTKTPEHCYFLSLGYKILRSTHNIVLRKTCHYSVHSPVYCLVKGFDLSILKIEEGGSKGLMPGILERE